MSWAIIYFAMSLALVIGTGIYLGDKIDKYEEKEAMEKQGMDISDK